MKKTFLLIACGVLLTGCAIFTPKETKTVVVHENPPPQDQKPEPIIVPTMGPHDYRYVIHGDPVVAPKQAFSDNAYLYLSFAPDQQLPLAYTTNGDIVEYDVFKNFIRMRKLDAVVLRIGPRRAYVNHQEVNIIRPYAEQLDKANAVLGIEVSYPDQKSIVIDHDTPVSDVIKRTMNWRGVHICHAPTVAAYKAVQRFEAALRALDKRVSISSTCDGDNISLNEGVF